jgi:hypothetical protein
MGTESHPPPPQASPKPSLTPYLGAALLLAVLMAGLALLLAQCEWMARGVAKDLQEAVAGVLQVHPEVRVNQTVVYGQSSPVAELAVLSREHLVELQDAANMTFWGIDIPWTTKSAGIKAIFRVKAGFDLTQPFRIDYDPATGDVDVEMPPAQILTVEMVRPVEWKESNAWFNTIDDADRARVLEALTTLARQSAVQSGLIEDAQREASTRIHEVLAPRAKGLQIEARPPR